MADDEIKAEEIARLGEGGLCLNCPVCTFPNCGFGKYMKKFRIKQYEIYMDKIHAPQGVRMILLAVSSRDILRKRQYTADRDDPKASLRT